MAYFLVLCYGLGCGSTFDQVHYYFSREECEYNRQIALHTGRFQVAECIQADEDEAPDAGN